jgi:hypothetical protein
MSNAHDDEALRTAYQRLLRERGASADRPGETDDVSLEAMLEVLQQRGAEADRLATLDRILSSHRHRAEFDVLRDAMNDVMHESATVPPLTNTRSPAPAGTRALWRMAAALVVTVGGGAWFAMRNRDATATSPLRDASSVSVLSATLLPPDSLRLTWTPVTSAQEYVLELLNDAGDAVLSRHTRDTSLVIARRDIPGARRAWLRTARIDGSTQTTPAVALPEFPAR